MKNYFHNLICILVTTAALSACSEKEPAPPTSASQSSTADTQAASGNDVWPKLQSPIAKDAALEQRIDDLMAQMRVEDKVGQIMQADIESVTPEDVRKYRLGSVLNGGDSRPQKNKHATPQQWLTLADEFYNASMDTSEGGVAIPVIWGTDAVHGQSNVIGATIYPHNIGLGAARDSELVRRIGSATAKEVAATGIDWTFAPTLAVTQDDRWGRTYESYSENPEIVAQYAGEMTKGLQGEVNTESFLNNNYVVATAKHFLGDGGTYLGIDQGDTRVTEKQLSDIHGAGYFPSLQAGAQTVMASYSSWNGTKMHGNPYLLTDVLKNQLGFDGFIVGDWNGHAQVPGCTSSSCAASLNAGLDMFMVPTDWKALYENTLAQVQNGEIPMSRLDDAVRRILRVKIRAGLFEKGAPSTRTLAGQFDLIGSAEHRALSREAARKSLVLLKNDGNVLPLDRKQTVAIVGDAADSLSKQMGGWTFTWQGAGNQNSDYPGATSILSGIKTVVEAAGGKVIVSTDGEGINNVDVVIAVIGENAYAEGVGDIVSNEYQPAVKTDLALLQKVSSKNIPVVTVFISGRPLWVNPEMNRSNAFVAAWLPGSEGAAIADVLFKKESGEVNYDFHGKLSFSWPKTADQIANYHQGENSAESYDPLFAWGYGLTYADSNTLGNNLDESGITLSPSQVDAVTLLDGSAQAPWQLALREGEGFPLRVRTEKQTGRMNAIEVTALDDGAGYNLNWSGAHKADVYIGSNLPMDFSSYVDNGVLEFSVRNHMDSIDSLTLSISCGRECISDISIESLIGNLTKGSWETVTVSLNCFDSDQMKFDQLASAFSVSTSAKTNLDLGVVQLKKHGADQASINCKN